MTQARVSAVRWGLALSVAHCGTDPATQADTGSRSCPAPPPLYTTDIAPLLNSVCSPCHFFGGTQYPKRDLSTYDAVYALRSNINTQVVQGYMPPADAATHLTDAQKTILLDWLACNAPKP